MASPSVAQLPAKRASKGSPLGPNAPARWTGPLEEVGVSGTTNYQGQLHTETNPALYGPAGYGLPGARAWGEWERLMRTDGAVETALNLTIAPLRDARLSVLPPKRETPETASQVGYLEQNLSEWLEPLWPEAVQQIGRYSLGVGFSLHEEVWDVGPSELVPGGQGFRLARLAQRLPSTLDWNAWEEKDGELVSVLQRGVKDGRYVSARLPAEKLLLVTWNREGNNYAGYSAFRPVWYLAKVREQLLRIIGIGHQREALGVPMASMDKDAELTPAARAKLRRVLMQLVFHENAAIVLPPGVKLEWFNSPGANKGHVLDTWRQLGVAILEVVSAQQVALGTQDTGSRAVGQVHDASKNSFIHGVKANIEAALNGVGRRPYTGLARKIIRANGGEQPSYPRVEMALPVASLTPSELMATVAQGVTAGVLTLTAEDENRLRKALGLDTLTPEVREKLRAEAAATPSTASTAPGGLSGEPLREGTQDKQPSPRPGTDSPPAPGRAVRPVMASRDAQGVYVPRRPLLPHETHLAWGEMDDLLTNAKEAFEAAARPLLVEALAAVLPQVKEAMADGDPSEVAGIQLPLEKLSALVDEYLAKLRAEGAAHVIREVRRPEVAKAVEEKRAEGEGGVAPVTPSASSPAAPVFSRTVHFAKPPKRRSPAEVAAGIERLMKAQRDVLLRRMRARTIDSLQRAAIDKVRTGGDAGSIVSDVISDALETRALRQDAAGITTAAFNLGREEAARKLGSVQTVRLSAVMDEVTCEYCERMDGAEFEFNSAAHDEHVPPLTRCEGRDRCRCIRLYGTAGFAVEEEYPEDNPRRDVGEEGGE